MVIYAINNVSKKGYISVTVVSELSLKVLTLAANLKFSEYHKLSSTSSTNFPGLRYASSHESVVKILKSLNKEKAGIFVDSKYLQGSRTAD